MNVETLARQLAEGYGKTVRIRARRPHVYQIEVPALLADGDAAQLFVTEATDQTLLMTDLGMTAMRLTYRRALTPDDDKVLSALATRHGFAFEGGVVSSRMPVSELFAGALGMVQVQAQADAAVRLEKARAERSESFKQAVREVLRESFKDRVEFDYGAQGADPEHLFTIDAAIHGGLLLLVAIVPSDVEAERAIGNKGVHDARLTERHRWAVVPRDLEELSKKSRKRLLKEFLPAGSGFAGEQPGVVARLRDLADAA